MTAEATAPELSSPTPSPKPSLKFNILWIVAAGILIIAFYLLASGTGAELFSTLQKPSAVDSSGGPGLSSFPALRSQYFREAFQPNRSEYHIFQKAADNFKLSPEEYSAYAKSSLLLESEADIFSSLPPIPDDFGEVAYELANGKFFDIGALEGEYYLQPELYPGFKTTGLDTFTKYDPKYWAPGGYGTYPSDQEDELVLGSQESFSAVVFVHSGWLVQTYQGVTLVPSVTSLEKFDIVITPDNFLLGPSWPKFSRDWVQKVVITGKLKPGVSLGNYKVELNVVTPPIDLQKKWGAEHRNLYFNASASGLSGHVISFDFHVVDTPTQ